MRKKDSPFCCPGASVLLSDDESGSTKGARIGCFVAQSLVGAVPAVLCSRGLERRYLAAAGTVYFAGALVYGSERVDPYPSVFGYHEIWHLCVAVASALTYLANYEAVRSAASRDAACDVGQSTRSGPLPGPVALSKVI